MYGRLLYRRAVPSIAVCALLLAVFAVLGLRVFSGLIGGGYADPASESAVAQEIVHQEIGGEVNLIVVVQAPEGSMAQDAASTGDEVAQDLRDRDDVESVHAFSDPGMLEPLTSDDGRSGLVAAHILGSEAEQTATSAELAEQMAGERADGTTVLLGGSAPTVASANEQVLKDLGLAEGIAVPVTLVLLLIVFGSVVSAVLPLGVGAFAVFGAFFSTWAITLVTDVSIFSINLITALGLGLAIDYSLLIVSRFREELDKRGLDRSSPRRGPGVEAALGRTLQTAGRTVLFTGLAVASALCALLVFPTPFLRSFGHGGIAVVLVAMLGALLLLPALLALIGTRIDALPVRRRGRVQPLSAPSAFWGRVGEIVHRRPLLTGLPVLALLAVLSLPLLGVQFSSPDDRALGEGHPARAAGEVLREDFPGNSSAATVGIVSSEVEPAALADYAQEASEADGVESVLIASGMYVDGQRVSPAPPGMQNQLESQDWRALRIAGPSDGLSEEALQVVRDLRELPEPAGGHEVAFTGTSARFLDDTHAVTSNLPLAAGLIALSTFVLVFLFTGSVLMPLKTLLMNVITLAAVLGATTLVFQEGWLSGLLGFTPGPLDMSMPVLLFCIAFGLSMDYELFLIGRMKEVWDRTHDNRTAVIEGLAHTGRITTLAAIVLSVTFAAFGTSQVTFMKLFGLGTAFAILLDATLVRGVLVPSFMRVAGRANWWAPGPLRRLHDRIGLGEASEPAEDDDTRANYTGTTATVQPRRFESTDNHMSDSAYSEVRDFSARTRMPPARRRGRHVAGRPQGRHRR